jgi:hypothetical protein
MRLVVILLFVILLSGCERLILTSEFDCDKQSTIERANFILKCIKNANPKSDEAPEHWLTICEDISKRTYCKKISGFKKWGMNPTFFIPCNKAKTNSEIEACQVDTTGSSANN